ncbi:MAG: DUF4349 domain-containing protein [Bacillus sp. (in: Bacteria)]|nr:DUF4349 domain-containing protein [Bacillus sp. (in: firmicutes)]MCM1427756.1 DUF4349 domain-containing protein [Eubacterium sp.]
MKKRSFHVIAAIIISCVILSGCGSSGKLSEGAGNTTAYDAGGVYATADTAAAEEVYESEMSTSDQAKAELLEENTQAAERKLIKTVDLSVETEEYDALLANLEQRIAGLGGYIEYQNQYNGSYYSGYQDTRNAYMQIRIPAGHMDEFILNVGEWTNIRDKEERVEDVTLRYVDLESHKKALTTEQDRLLELLEKAESVEDIITIEQRLSDVRYELESMESQLRTLNNQIDYSTINLNIQEVRRLTPTEEKTVWDKMRNGFVQTIYNIGDDIESGFIWFVINIPYFVIWIVVIVIVLVLWRIGKKAWHGRKVDKINPNPDGDERKDDSKDGE